MAHLGHPLLGDSAYGSGFKTKANRLSEPQKDALRALNRQALHAAILGFEHPRSGEFLRFESPLPADMAALLGALREAI
jgi:23S rRNA pseudouridine1911/1915/1917 synthase